MEYVFPRLDIGAWLARAETDLPEETVDHVNRQIYRSFHGRRPGEIPPGLFQLRYQVYCLEYGFLDPDDYLDGMEVDEYDHCSMHFAAYSAANPMTAAAPIGTVRLVRPGPAQPFPFQLHCPTFPGFDLPARELCGEVSRLAVTPGHRRRRADSVAGIPGLSVAAGFTGAHLPVERRERSSPMLLLGMYREMVRYSRRHGVRYWFAAMERSLARSLERMGFRFEPIGPEADYYGAVRPYILDLDRLSANVAQVNPALAAWFDETPLVFASRDLQSGAARMRPMQPEFSVVTE